MQTLISTILATTISNEVEKIDVEMSRHNRVNHFQPSFFTVALNRSRKCKTNVMHRLSMWNRIAKIRLNRDVVVLVQVLNTGIFLVVLHGRKKYLDGLLGIFFLRMLF